MKKQNKLLIQRGMFLFIIFVLLGIIIVTEKAHTFMIPRINKKIENYINNNYLDIKESLKIDDLIYNNSNYSLKITDSKNKYHYFYIYYENNKIKDTYKEDFKEGKPLMNHLKKNLEKEILERTKTNTKVEIIANLNQFTTSTQDRLLKEENLLELKFYTLEKEIIMDNWNSKEIVNNIVETIKKYQEKGITPKYYSIMITNKNNIKDSITIKQLTEEFINNKENEQLIKEILNNNKDSLLLKKYKITYQ